MINWEGRLSAVDAILASADEPVLAIGRSVRNGLYRAGRLYDRFDPWDEDPLTESSEHVAWRSEMASILGAMDEVGQYADGGPPSSISSSDIPGSMATVIGRLEAAVAEGGYGGEFAEIALRTRRFPGEPRFYVASHYRRPTSVTQWSAQWFGAPLAGPTYAALLEEMERSAAFLDLAS